MLHDVNSYVRSFMYALDTAPSPDFSIVINADERPQGEHERRFNAPTCNEVAAVIHGEQHNSRDIIISSRSNRLQRINETHRSYDALQYPLLFPYGEDGYHFGIPLHLPGNHGPASSRTVSCRAFYSYRFMIRKGEFDLLPRCHQLFNQYAVDMAAKMESERLLYIKLNQSKLRVDSYIHLHDVLQQDTDPRNIGKPCILPSTFTGGPRYMRERMQDALTYVRIYGCSDLFITYTCNPKCDEITRELLPGQTYTHRHDIVARVFRLNLGKMMDLIVKGQIFGPVRCHMHSIEWQKRGLPHAHILIWLTNKIEADDIDKFISAEIPDPAEGPQLHEIVRTTMVHGPCGPNYDTKPCYQTGPTCSKGFPKRFVLQTQTGGDGYPLYKRRDPANGSRTVTVGCHQVDNNYIVPYCPLLSKIFKAHVNVEYCSSIKSIQYVCKYINKGNDAAMFSIQGGNSLGEVSNYLAG